MESLNVKLPDEVARSLAKQAADAGVSPHDYVVNLVTQNVCLELDDDLAELLKSRMDESNDIEDSPELWAGIMARIDATRNSRP